MNTRRRKKITTTIRSIKVISSTHILESQKENQRRGVAKSPAFIYSQSFLLAMKWSKASVMLNTCMMVLSYKIKQPLFKVYWLQVQTSTDLKRWLELAFNYLETDIQLALSLYGLGTHKETGTKAWELSYGKRKSPKRKRKLKIEIWKRFYILKFHCTHFYEKLFHSFRYTHFVYSTRFNG